MTRPLHGDFQAPAWRQVSNNLALEFSCTPPPYPIVFILAKLKEEGKPEIFILENSSRRLENKRKGWGSKRAGCGNP